MIYTSAHKMYNYAIMRVEDNLLTYVVYNQVGETIDSFKIVK